MLLTTVHGTTKREYIMAINLERTTKMVYNKGYDKGRSDAFKVVIFFTLYSCAIVGIVKVLLFL